MPNHRLHCITRKISDEITLLLQEQDTLLAMFPHPATISFAEENALTAERKEKHLAFLFSLTASLRKTDEIAIALAKLVAESDHPKYDEFAKAIQDAWLTYEQYRQVLLQYVSDTQAYTASREDFFGVSLSKLLQYNRSLHQALCRYRDRFSTDYVINSKAN